MSASAAHMSSCTRRISSCVSAGRHGRQHADRDAVAPVEETLRTDQALRAVEHHGKDVRAGLLRQREGPGLEAVDLAVLRTRAFGEDGHGGSAGDPHAALAEQLLHRLRGTAAVDADVAVQEEKLPEEGDLIDLALGDPAEIERQVVERRNVDHRVVVHDDDIGPAAVDPPEPLDPLPPEGRHGEENPYQHAREEMHDTARAVERPADHQRDGRKQHEKGAQQHQKQVIEGTQHNLGSERNAPHGAAFGGAGSRYTILINPSSKDSDFFRDS